MSRHDCPGDAIEPLTPEDDAILDRIWERRRQERREQQAATRAATRAATAGEGKPPRPSER